MTEGVGLNVGNTTDMRLSRALLVYEGRDSSPEPGIYYGKKTAFVTVHGIAENGSGQPILGPGQALRPDVLAELLRNLRNAPSERSIQSERVLYSDAGMLLFWVPAGRRPIFFAARPTSKEKERKINQISGQVVHHPALLVLAELGSLHIYALAENQRPTASTEVFRAPYYNLYDGGSMCIGNVALPNSLDPSDDYLKRWEDAFFLTNFTHSNYGASKITTFRGGHDSLWLRQAKTGKGFPNQHLISEKVTVADVLKNHDSKKRRRF
jgi:PRTRC genetic system protein B